MNNLDKLIRSFEQFPGIGARQARRFAFHVLTLPPADVTELTELLSTLQDTVMECTSCRRFFSKTSGNITECAICISEERDRSLLMVVERDSDIQAVERSGMYEGLYFVLGGTVSLLKNQTNKKLRSNGLKHIVESRLLHELSEIILAFSVNPDGENTSRFVESILQEYIDSGKLKVSYLGRGLSTGSELEYADPETIKNAFKHRQ